MGSSLAITVAAGIPQILYVYMNSGLHIEGFYVVTCCIKIVCHQSKFLFFSKFAQKQLTHFLGQWKSTQAIYNICYKFIQVQI
jgi:hypothetical protein